MEKGVTEEIMKYSFSSSFTRLVWVTIVFVLLLTIAGRIVFLTGAALTCSGSPVCIPTSSLGWLKFIHLGLVGISALLMIWLFLKAWREQRDDQMLLPLTTVTTVLFFGQAFVGAIQVVRNFPVHLVVLHTLTAVLLWISLIALAVISGLSAQDGKQFPKVDIRQRINDFFVAQQTIDRCAFVGHDFWRACDGRQSLAISIARSLDFAWRCVGGWRLLGFKSIY